MGTHSGGGLIANSYRALNKSNRPKPIAPKHITGYTGQLPGAMGQIEKTYTRIARECENGLYKPQPVSFGGTFAPNTTSYSHKPVSHAPPDYKLPGYTGYIPQVKYTFEQRYSASTDSAAAGITGGAGYRFGGGTHLNR